jgi:coproporphyrinogen III oxidase-like Fe-S oxidoreductase
MLNALRLNDGFSSQQYRQRTGLDLRDLDVKLARARERGLLQRYSTDPGESDANWRPTDLGRRFLNDLQASFLA